MLTAQARLSKGYAVQAMQSAPSRMATASPVLAYFREKTSDRLVPGAVWSAPGAPGLLAVITHKTQLAVIYIDPIQIALASCWPVRLDEGPVTGCNAALPGGGDGKEEVDWRAVYGEPVGGVYFWGTVAEIGWAVQCVNVTVSDVLICTAGSDSCSVKATRCVEQTQCVWGDLCSARRPGESEWMPMTDGHDQQEATVASSMVHWLLPAAA